MILYFTINEFWVLDFDRENEMNDDGFFKKITQKREYIEIYKKLKYKY